MSGVDKQYQVIFSERAAEMLLSHIPVRQKGFSSHSRQAGHVSQT